MAFPDLSAYPLAEAAHQWRAAHAVFDEVRTRLLATSSDAAHAQYAFEESCCQALYNATYPPDEFDPSSAFFVVPTALAYAEFAGMPPECVGEALKTR